MGLAASSIGFGSELRIWHIGIFPPSEIVWLPKESQISARVVLPCRPSPQFINSATTHAPRRRRRQPFYEGLIRNFVQERLSLLGIILTCNIFVTGREEEEEEEESTRRSRKELFPKTVSPAARHAAACQSARIYGPSLARSLFSLQPGKVGALRRTKGGRRGAQFKGQLLSRFGCFAAISLVKSASPPTRRIPFQ